MAPRWNVIWHRHYLFILPSTTRVPRNASTLCDPQWIDALVKQAIESDSNAQDRFAELAREHVPALMQMCDSPTLFERYARLGWPRSGNYRRIDDISETQAAHVYATLSVVLAAGDHDFVNLGRHDWDAGRAIMFWKTTMPSRAVIRLLINAAPPPPDDPLASALRRRCGLGVSESSGWLPLVCDFRPPHVGKFRWPARVGSYASRRALCSFYSVA